MAYDPRTSTGIPTEPVGSLPRPSVLQQAYARYDAGEIGKDELAEQQEAAVRDSIERFEATGSPIISDGEQRWSSFATYPITDTLTGTGLAPTLTLAGGQYFAIFADGHNRPLPRLARGPFTYVNYAADSLAKSLPLRPQADEAGRHLPVDARAALPAARPGGGLLARRLRGRAGRRVREGHPAGVRGGRGAGVGRLHRGAPRDPARTRATRGRAPGCCRTSSS